MSTADQRRRHVEAWRRSGLSRTAYSRQHGLHPTTFSAWVRQASVEGAPVASEPAPVLVPVEVRREEETSIAGVVLWLPGGARLELPAAVSARWLAELLRCLG